MEDADLEPSRKALLQYYNTQTMTHGGYIIALVIGFTTLVSRWSEFTSSLLAWEFFLFLNSLLLAGGIYILLRTLFWGYLASYVMYAGPSKEGETIMMKLHLGSDKIIEKKHRHVNYFMGFNQKKVKPILCVIFSVTWILLSLLSFLLMRSLYVFPA